MVDINLRPGVGIHLMPVMQYIYPGPVSELLYKWHEVKFDVAKCKKIYRAYMKEHKLNNTVFSQNFFDSGTLGSKKYFYSSPVKEWYFGIRTNCYKKQAADFGTYVKLNDVKKLAKLIAKIPDLTSQKEAIKVFDFVPEQIVKNAFSPGQWAARGANNKPLPPGIYRKEHACVVISSGTTQIIVDPVFIAARGTPTKIPWKRPNHNLGAPVDAILITHSHLDHWNLPSLLATKMYKNGKVIVPWVPKENVNTCDYSSQLKNIGAQHKVGRWGETYKVGNIEIDILPFYGEQASAKLSIADKNLRNWGNCYRVNTPQFSALLLVDSGKDPEGNMLQVVEKSVKQKGPVDFVLSCMREFASPFIPIGLSSYILSLSFSQLKELSNDFHKNKLEFSTAGPEGIVQICKAAKARGYMPYAQGYVGEGIPIPFDDWGPSRGGEKEAMSDLSKKLKKAKSKTKSIEWNPGDRIYLKGKAIARQKFKPLF